ncbi:hypothetical protein ABC195_15080 [Microbacterium sp. 2P01SA-2]|uniref:hypothetical protein n=1 Tax=Microbacterium TaxID=33882 RepID=UPI00277F6A71|nr:hypothetical protein [Microbacterium arborescens]MDQ1215752.1 hypothetical protein [Microbacterium arborescens]
MGEELPPSLFKILREDLSATRAEVNSRLDGLASGMVTQAMLAQVTANQKERDERQDARLRDLESKEDERNREVRQVTEDLRKQRAQQMFSFALAAFGAVLSVIGGVIVWTVTSGLQQVVSR